MSRLTVAAIVEGQSDEAAIRLLLTRVWIELLGAEYLNVLKPIRRPRGKLLKPDSSDLENALQLANYKLAEHGGGLVLILIDAEDDCARLGSLGPLLLHRAKNARPDIDIACVIANVMYESWFVAAADSLHEHLRLDGVPIPPDAEAARAGKAWIKSHIRSGKYSPTADQARLTAKLNLHACRQRSKSFDKLCRELANRIHT